MKDFASGHLFKKILMESVGITSIKLIKLVKFASRSIHLFDLSCDSLPVFFHDQNSMRIAGGLPSSNNDKVFVYDFPADTWTELPPLLEGR